MINTSKRRISYSHLNDVLFSARMLTSNRTWVSSFIISSRQTAVFFRQSIGNARIVGRIWKVTKSARDSRAEPEEKKSSSVMRSFIYDMLYRYISEWISDDKRKEIMGSFWLGNLDLVFDIRISEFATKHEVKNQTLNLKNPFLTGDYYYYKLSNLWYHEIPSFAFF